MAIRASITALRGVPWLSYNYCNRQPIQLQQDSISSTFGTPAKVVVGLNCPINPRSWAPYSSAPPQSLVEDSMLPPYLPATSTNGCCGKLSGAWRTTTCSPPSLWSIGQHCRMLLTLSWISCSIWLSFKASPAPTGALVCFASASHSQCVFQTALKGAHCLIQHCIIFSLI